jgi:hypothetical protein
MATHTRRQTKAGTGRSAASTTRSRPRSGRGQTPPAGPLGSLNLKRSRGGKKSKGGVAAMVPGVLKGLGSSSSKRASRGGAAGKGAAVAGLTAALGLAVKNREKLMSMIPGRGSSNTETMPVADQMPAVQGGDMSGPLDGADMGPPHR